MWPFVSGYHSLVYTPKGLKTSVQTKTCAWMFIAILFIIADGGKIQMSMNWWMKKPNVTYPHNAYYSSIKKNEVLIILQMEEPQNMMKWG